MSMFYRANGHVPVLVFDDGRTKQSFKDQTDITMILKKAQKTGSIDHLTKWGGTYADFSDFDFDESSRRLARGSEVFADLPSEIRSEFNQSPREFFDFVNDDNNKDRLAELFPKLAEPGQYFPDVSNATPPGTLLNEKDVKVETKEVDSSKE